MIFPSSRRLIAIPLTLILGDVTAALAENLSYGVAVGVGETDNVTLTPTEKVSQTLAVADIDFLVAEERRLFDISAKGNFSYLDFLQGAYNDELIGRFDGLAHVELVPGIVTWALKDDFGQAQIDPFATATPTNLENINFLSTGPDLKLRLGTLGFVDVAARYAHTQYQVSPFDNNRYTGSIAVGEPLSAFSVVSLNGTAEHVVFDNTLVNTNFERYGLYGGYELQGVRTGITANAGVIQVDQDLHPTTGPVLKLQGVRKVSPAAVLTFSAGRTLTDGSASFGNLHSGASGVIDNAPASQTSTNYTVSYASAQWTYNRSRTTFSLSGTWEKDDYVGMSSLDLKREGMEFNMQRRLSQVLTAQLIGSIEKTDYRQHNFVDTDGQVGLRFTLHDARGLELRFDYAHNFRIVSGVGTGYEANRAQLTVGYRPKPPDQAGNPGRIVRPEPGPGINP
jgi:hypothetical protein